VKRLGPELKMPKLKSGETGLPPFFTDLYVDLRERRLLPLVALVVAAIVATPILLASGSTALKPVVPPVSGQGGPSGSARTLTVVKAEPGLRNYKKRFARRKPTNPFKQRFDEPNLKGGKLNEQTTTTTTTTEEGGGSSGGGATSPSGGGSSNGKEVPQSGIVYYTFAANVQVTKIVPKKNGGVEKSGPTVHKEVIPPAVLPGEKAQVVTYMGISKEGKALFLISPKVEQIFGEGKCVAGEEICQLVELEPKFAETFFFGPNGVRYKINVLKIVPKIVGHS
jgi:hypothetical protein